MKQNIYTLDLFQSLVYMIIMTSKKKAGSAQFSTRENGKPYDKGPCKRDNQDSK